MGMMFLLVIFAGNIWESGIEIRDIVREWEWDILRSLKWDSKFRWDRVEELGFEGDACCFFGRWRFKMIQHILFLKNLRIALEDIEKEENKWGLKEQIDC